MRLLRGKEYDRFNFMSDMHLSCHNSTVSGHLIRSSIHEEIKSGTLIPGPIKSFARDILNSDSERVGWK